MQLPDVYPLLITAVSALLMLTFWWFLSEKNLARAKTLFLQAPLAIGIFALAWLTEKLIGNFGLTWVAIIIAAPVLEELARYLITDLFELEHPHEGLFFGIIIGIAETILLLGGMHISSSAIIFRVIFSQPLHATCGMCLLHGRFSLPANILVHFFFNYGIFVGGMPGMIIASSALLANIARIIFAEPATNQNPA